MIDIKSEPKYKGKEIRDTFITFHVYKKDLTAKVEILKEIAVRFDQIYSIEHFSDGHSYIYLKDRSTPFKIAEYFNTVIERLNHNFLVIYE